MITSESHDTILTWRGLTVRLFPPHDYYCYLLHFDHPHYHAKHYLGMTSNLDSRLLAHRGGHSAKLMEAIHKAGIGFQLVRLWQCETWEEARQLEKRLKQRHGSNVLLCPLCQGKPFDTDVMLRLGHFPFSRFAKQARPRRPMPAFQNAPMRGGVL